MTMIYYYFNGMLVSIFILYNLCITYVMCFQYFLDLKMHVWISSSFCFYECRQLLKKTYICNSFLFSPLVRLFTNYAEIQNVLLYVFVCLGKCIFIFIMYTCVIFNKD